MTQMLLFDSPAKPAETTVLPVAETVAHSIAGQASRDQNIATEIEHDSGLHHMGDLARLVLLRYDLVAKRRALMAARKAAK